MPAVASRLGCRTDRRARIRIKLVEGFELTVEGEVVDTPVAAQRLVAFLALHPRPLTRSFVAGSLWLDKTDSRATSNLRSSLWRARVVGDDLIRSSRTHLHLANDVYVDAAEMDSVARCILAGRLDVDVGAQLLSGELLPDWYEEWVLLERERLRQLCLNALEQLSALWLAKGELALAIDAACTAVAAEPLRETAHRALVEAHLLAGNRGEAARQYTSYRRILQDALGLEPSSAFARRVSHLLLHV